MSQKPKRQFLKKGTRQFLSNAQVRSQINKPKIVDFGADQVNQNEQIKPALQKIFKQQPKKLSKFPSVQLIKKKQSSKQQKQFDIYSPFNQQSKKVIENNYEQMQFQFRNKKSMSTTLQQRQDRTLTLNKKISKQIQEEDNLNLYLNKKQKSERRSIQKKQERSDRRSIQKKQSKKEQSIQQVKQIRKKISVPEKLLEKPPLPDKKVYRKYKQDPSSQEEIIEKSQKKINLYNFNDNQEWINNQMKKDNQGSKNKLTKQVQLQKMKENRQQSNEKFVQKSKLVQKYFDPKQKRISQPGINSKSISMEDIPQQIKQKIIEQGMKKAKQKLENELQKIRNESNNTKKIKCQYQQLIKQFEKQKKEQQKELQLKKTEFQEYMKEEKSKIAKDKKIIKDSLESKYTNRKDKQQLQQLKIQIQVHKEEKKKIQQKYKLENDRMKKRLEEQILKNKKLQQQIQLLQMARIKQKQIKQQQKKQNKNNLNINNINPINNNTNVINNNNTNINTKSSTNYTAVSIEPKTDANILKMKEQNFSLMNLNKEIFKYDSNQFFKYYLKHKNDDLELESQKRQEDRVKRIYKNGKVEHQYYKKFLKQVFNNFSIVHHSNGDIKQTLPQGVVIYFDTATKIVEFTISPNKKIHYFYIQDQVEMVFEKDNGEIHETYDGINLKRKLPNGHIQFFKNSELKQISKPNNIKALYSGASKQLSYPKNYKAY